MNSIILAGETMRTLLFAFAASFALSSTAFALNPQPLPPKADPTKSESIRALNPQPLPPLSGDKKKVSVKHAKVSKTKLEKAKLSH